MIFPIQCVALLNLSYSNTHQTIIQQMCLNINKTKCLIALIGDIYKLIFSGFFFFIFLIGILLNMVMVMVGIKKGKEKKWENKSD